MITSCGRIGYATLSDGSQPDGSVPDGSMPDGAVPDGSVPDGSVEPSCTDGQQNGDETGVDCGGSCSECITEWARSFGGTDGDNSIAIGVDSVNNLYVTGTFQGTIDFGGDPLVGTEGTDEVFLASFDSHGMHRWSKLVSLPDGNKTAYDLAIDSNDNVVIVANVTFFGTISSIHSYDSNGNLRWTQSLGNGSDELGVYMRSVSTDANGDVYVVGSYSGVFGQDQSHHWSQDIFVVRFDGNTGAELWRTAYGSPTTDVGLDIVVAPDGSYFITGTYDGDIYIAAFDSDAQQSRWELRISSAGQNSGQAIALVGNNQLLVGGTFEQQVDFGTGMHTSNGATDGFLVSLDPVTAQIQWAKQFGGTDVEEVHDIYVTEAGKVLLSGAYHGTFNIEGTPFTGQGSWDAYVVSYDALSGAYDAWQNYGGSGEDRGYGLALDQHGTMYMTGNYSESIELAGETLTSVGDSDIFFMRTIEP